MSDRPSYLEVDTQLARQDERALQRLRGDPEWDEHLAATAPPEEVPDWVHALADPPRARPSRWWAAGALLAAALVLLLLLPRDPYVGEKSSASALLYVERAGLVTLWDGERALLAGDRFRLELHDLGTPWFAVLYQEPGQPPVVLATGAGEGLLEGAWTFDAPAAGSRLLVVGLAEDPEDLPANVLLERPALVILSLR